MSESLRVRVRRDTCWSRVEREETIRVHEEIEIDVAETETEPSGHSPQRGIGQLRTLLIAARQELPRLRGAKEQNVDSDA